MQIYSRTDVRVAGTPVYRAPPREVTRGVTLRSCIMRIIAWTLNLARSRSWNTSWNSLKRSGVTLVKKLDVIIMLEDGKLYFKLVLYVEYIEIHC